MGEDLDKDICTLLNSVKTLKQTGLHFSFLLFNFHCWYGPHMGIWARLEGPSLAYDHQTAWASSEDNTGLNMNEEPRNIQSVHKLYLNQRTISWQIWEPLPTITMFWATWIETLNNYCETFTPFLFKALFWLCYKT